jgi:guanine deaminase
MSARLTDERLAGLARQAVEISLEHVSKGGIPFSGLVVDADGEVIGTGVNRVVVDRDPLAHAEVVAMREAASRTGRPWLDGTTLIASGEPCGLCYYAALYFTIDEVVYVVDRNDAARYGFDYTGSYRSFVAPPERWPQLKVRHLTVDGGLEPFEVYSGRRRIA